MKCKNYKYGNPMCNFCAEKLFFISCRSYDSLIAPPPIGIKPKFIWDSERKQDLKNAIIRYLESEEKINIEWVEEYNSLIKNIKNEKIS